MHNINTGKMTLHVQHPAAASEPDPYVDSYALMRLNARMERLQQMQREIRGQMYPLLNALADEVNHAIDADQLRDNATMMARAVNHATMMARERTPRRAPKAKAKSKAAATPPCAPPVVAEAASASAATPATAAAPVASAAAAAAATAAATAAAAAASAAAGATFAATVGATGNGALAHVASAVAEDTGVVNSPSDSMPSSSGSSGSSS